MRFALLLGMTILAACTGQSDRSEFGATSRAGSSADTSASAALLTYKGIGPIRIGMTIAEARTKVPSFSVPAEAEKGDCDYARFTGLPQSVRAMVENGVIVRVDVDSNDVATVEGARVGDSEDRIRTLYPGRVEITDHKYVDGHYLTVKPAAAADSAYRIVFETMRGHVMLYHAGQLPQVRYVEGCG